ncbi:MAG: lysine--tRNA ligase [Candidatus Omnitrophica bacterium]|nr:lysine--tRNA ligase [Candidatus Omnitrophota bacterium]
MTDNKKTVRDERIDMIRNLRENGVNPFPDRCECTHRLHEALELPENADNIRLAGRIIAIRKMGKLSFSHIQDADGKIQLCLTQDDLGKENYTFFKKSIDIGDFIGVKGSIFVTKTGEKTLRVTEFQLLSKAILTLPEKWHGLSDLEACYRQRYLDLIVNEESRRRFQIRRDLIRKIRHYLEDHDFMEVETPILQSKPSGALAKPFITHHNSLDLDVYMRIAPETYLKRLIVGGYTRVFEFAHCFRNEGISTAHLQEFLMLEYYAAFWNYEDNMDFTERMLTAVLQKVLGNLTIEYKGNSIDFSTPWPRKSLRDVVLEGTGIDINQVKERDALLKQAEDKSIDLSDVNVDALGWGSLVDAIYKKACRPNILSPLFLTSHPKELSPLARANDEDPSITDRFQVVVMGMEIVNAYSELVDPIDQRERLQKQQQLRDAGDDEAMEFDEDYIHCMEYGMPPISGWGMGIDRLTALLTNEENIKNTVYFPLMRPLESRKKFEE